MALSGNIAALAALATRKLRGEDVDEAAMRQLINHAAGCICHSADSAAAVAHLNHQGTAVSRALGADALALLLCERGDVLSRVRKLGLTDEWLRVKLGAGENIRLALFPLTEAVPATWDGVMRLVRTHYPKVSSKVDACEVGLRTERFVDIQRRASEGFLRASTFFEIDEAAVDGKSSDPRYIDSERLASPTCSGSLEEVRGWLYHVIGLTEVFDGCGWTKDRRGARVAREYLVRNRTVAEFGDGFAWIELPISLADLESASAATSCATPTRAAALGTPWELPTPTTSASAAATRGRVGTATRVTSLTSSQRDHSLLRRFCCCFLCLFPARHRRRFTRFDDEPSAEFRRRMESAQTALDANARRKSTLPAGGSPVLAPAVGMTPVGTCMSAASVYAATESEPGVSKA